MKIRFPLLLKVSLWLLVNLALLAANRCPDRPVWRALMQANAVFRRVCAGALAGFLLVTQVPAIEALFHLAPLGIDGWLAALAGPGRSARCGRRGPLARGRRRHPLTPLGPPDARGRPPLDRLCACACS